jgi:hypothetical protein
MARAVSILNLVRESCAGRRHATIALNRNLLAMWSLKEKLTPLGSLQHAGETNAAVQV